MEGEVIMWKVAVVAAVLLKVFTLSTGGELGAGESEHFGERGDFGDTGDFDEKVFVERGDFGEEGALGVSGDFGESELTSAEVSSVTVAG